MEPDVEKASHGINISSNSPTAQALPSNRTHTKNGEIGFNDDDNRGRSLWGIIEMLPPGSFCDESATTEITSRWDGVRAEDVAKANMIFQAARLSENGVTEDAFARFSWLNRMNLMFYQHELRKMNWDYQHDLALLAKPNEIERLRTTVEAYSNFLVS